MTTNQSRIAWGAVALLSLGVAGYAWHYLLPGAFAPPGIKENPRAYPWLFVHAGLAGTAMALGPFQFLPRLRLTRPRLHRWIGRTYVFACLTGGSAGLLLATGSTAGPIARVGFGALAVTWLAVTSMAWRMALARRFDEHRRWMIRSFALTFAAVTLRLYLPIGAVLGFQFLDAYRAIAWLCWVPNLLAAELYLARRPFRAPQPAGA
ncbi:DUF2306 domain-containing protein [Phenylobacterium sp.]|uniref:DUF2306 domain-containing protein n=1 Tax=Phenylobacterium sp. TaxID=1871053 RepID=UPI002DF2F932|nr:DUF2306 domain-containing protein [Phenylobacterium sp.]